jgi:hypothetical protein
MSRFAAPSLAVMISQHGEKILNRMKKFSKSELGNH